MFRINLTPLSQTIPKPKMPRPQVRPPPPPLDQLQAGTMHLLVFKKEGMSIVVTG